jgi:hypothetical protein
MTQSSTFREAPPSAYLAALAGAQDQTKGPVTVADMLGEYTADSLATARCFLSTDGLTGFVVDGADLQGLFNVGPAGRGSLAVQHALRNGARTLDCFAPFLPRYYARHGFIVDRLEANWTPGGPDVAYMTYAPAAALAAALSGAVTA